MKALKALAIVALVLGGIFFLSNQIGRFFLALPDGEPCPQVTRAEAEAGGAVFGIRNGDDRRGVKGLRILQDGNAAVEDCVWIGDIFSCGQPGPATVYVRSGNARTVFVIDRDAVIGGTWDEIACVMPDPA
ncbi:hypothetical protein [Roseisalinus antarcticus]|uniref:Uncharacterized protein n=1 Tax=Roseisalinus antarcticus TaxID=254357 RepID=A0A1Y5SPR9_9RHOB|nr:hypothetical protein [Roseisalinus antarcticus]SLN45518.1 hypothetical protein ROA7023_01888 [Roseisalinus antarcticus]